MPNSPKQILVIDDSKDNRFLLASLLRAQGWIVQGASNGSDALLMLKEQSSLPDLILLDLEMPVMDGRQFRTEQRLDERLKNIPVIVMSACDDPTEITEMSPNGYLAKPLRAKGLIQRMNTFL